MLQRWKLILTNWNNCYFIEQIKDEQKINIESLIHIISHLRQNYNLDESKSSVLEAHTVKEFIHEKYPEFKFENGTAEPKTEDEIYMVASLLLFFVCVNSKDVQLKNAMCSKLCSEDQETILKFSKSLLECSAITYRVVQTAITEACGQDIAAMEVTHSTAVSETPPAFRSLHSEVRRLQAALDAEMFDRNYLQEELARTNARVDKLLKEKQQHKIEIVNLKAKISLCCGEESETIGVESDDRSAMLRRQLHELEEKLVKTQEQLDDVVYQRDAHKAKIDELKHERNKWLTLHQEEATRASQLSEELEIERRQNTTLQELVAELRQHNKLNGVDSSSLECDDPDASIQSLPHNASVCSEVCANVVEVQLGEERAKIVLLTQQLQTLQDQMNELNKKANAEKLALKDDVAERDHNIFNLKHRINEEIEDKNNLKFHYDDEITKLNNQINELEQILKENNDHSRTVIEKKMLEIQTLQEEKLSLIQSLNNKTTNLEKDIRDLKAEIDTEKQSKSNMKDSYENHLMKLNEKVLKKNNALVELQNNICEKSEMIESLQHQLKKEKGVAKTLGDYCNSLNNQKFAMINDLENKSHKINELQKNLQIRITNIEDLNIEISNLKTSVTSLNENCKELESLREKLVSEVNDRDAKIEEVLKDIEIIKEEYCKEKEKLILDLDERNETVNSLQVQLKDEIDFKIELQTELSQLNTLKATMTENFEKLETELTKLKTEIENNEKTIDAMDLYIQEMKKSNEKADEKVRQMTEDIAAKENDIKLLNNQLEVVNESLQEETKKKYDLLSELEPLHEQVKSLCNDNAQLQKDMTAKCQEILELRDDIEKLSQQLDDKELMIQALEHKFIDECKKYDQFELKALTEMTKLTSKINETNNIASECANVLTKEIIEKDSHNIKLNAELERLKEDLIKAQEEIKAFMEKLALELAYKNNLEGDYQIQYGKLENLTAQFNSEIESKNVDIDLLKTEIQSLKKNIQEKSEDIKELEEQIRQDTEGKSELAYQMKTETKKLQNKIVELEELNEEIEQELKKEMDANGLVVNAMKIENEQLHYAIEEDNSNHEVLIKEKDNVIDKLERTVKNDAEKFNDLHKYSEELKQSWEEYKNQTTASLKVKDGEIITLKDEILHENSNFQHLLEEKDISIGKLEQTAKEGAAKFKYLHDYSEELIRSWEDYKAHAKTAQKEKDEEITALKNNVLVLEKTVLEAEQTKNESCEQMSKIKENMKDIEIILSKEIAAREVIEKEMEQLLTNNKALLAIKKQLSEEIEVLSQKIGREKCIVKIAEDEKNSLLSEKIKIKEHLVKELETVSSLLQDKECLAQQLVEERNSKEIAEKERDNSREEKKLLEERLIEEEKVKSVLCEELQTLTQQIKMLQLNVEEEKKGISILEQEKETLNKELNQAKTNHHYLMEENQDLVIENDNVKKQLEMIHAEQVTLANSLETQINKVDMLEIEKSDMERRVHILHLEASKLENTLKDIREKLDKKETQYEEVAILLKVKEEELNYLQQAVVEKMQHIIREAEADNITVNENIVKLAEGSDRFQQEADKLLAINDKLKASLRTEKSVREQIEIERNDLDKKLSDLKAQFDEIKGDMSETVNGIQDTCRNTTEQLRNKEEELIQIDAELKLLKIEHGNVQDMNTSLSEQILNGLNKLMAKIKSENFKNEIFNASENFRDCSLTEKCLYILRITESLISEIDDLKNVEIAQTNDALAKMEESLKQKEIEIFELKTELNRLQQIVSENKIEGSKQTESYVTSMNSKINDIQTLQKENQTLYNDLNDVKVQLETKVHSLKEKLVDNEHLTDKLKKTYECQIENLNVMITKLTSYLKDKTQELEALRRDKELLNETIEENRKVIKSLEDDVKMEKQNIDKIITDFDAERQVLKNMVTVTESVMEDQKTSLNNNITEHLRAKETLQDHVNELTKVLKETEKKHHSIEVSFNSILFLLRRERVEKDLVEKESEDLREYLDELVRELIKERISKASTIASLETRNNKLIVDLDKYKNDIEVLQKDNNEMKIVNDSLEKEIKSKTDELSKVNLEISEVKETFKEQIKNLTDAHTVINESRADMKNLVLEKEGLELEKAEMISKLEALKDDLETFEMKQVEDVTKLKNYNQELVKTVEENKTVIENLEQLIKHELDQNRKLREDMEYEKLSLDNKCSTLQDYQEKAEKVLEDRQKEIVSLTKEVETLQAMVEICQQDSKAKDGLISKMSKEKDAIISTISKELVEEKLTREKCEKELENQRTVLHELKNNMEVRALRKENEQLIRAIGRQETFAALCQEKVVGEKYLEHRETHQVDNTSSDNTQSSIESLKTITDLEKIIHDKNRTITTLQHDVTYLKSLMAESETKLLDVDKELEVSKENCQQLSSQLKKIVFQKNEEIAELKKQVSKMSVTENRASQIIKVSAKYQAIILRRIAEIKSTTILKELTNFGNTNSDNDVRRGLTAGTVTMEDLENFLETTDRHLKRCSEKQVALQKERDRLTEVNRINESEIINLKKFLTELSVSFQTFNSVKGMYAQKLSRVVSVQRTVRREILNLESRVTDAAMCRLERGYAAVMQDLSECAMNLERWVERCISRTVSVEKIKQAFTSDTERSSLASPSFQNTGLDIQLDELDKSFQKLLEEVARAQKGDGAKDTQATTVMEVRAEYEDKLNRMKAKMKELFNEQMAVFKEKHREEMSLLERELQKTRDRMEESKIDYEKYIRQLSKELWSVGEKYLVKNDEAEWLRKKQRSGSLMSLQHVHSSGLIQPAEPSSRPSDTSSLRSLQVANNTRKREGRQMHMSDEEGEVFDNRCLKELSTPRREAPPGQRLSELKWRNSLCPPHLKSSYPAETQFATVLDEEDLKAGAGPPKPQRKEVGITAYKKPGPPTPSKQAGRLSATGSELRESLRVEGEPHADRRTSTPARIRNFLRFGKNDTNEGTPRTRRLSNIFRKNR